VRGHPLIGRRLQLLGGILLALLVLGVAVRTMSTATPATAVSVKISTAPGETLAFDPAEITVRAAGPITVTFRNRSSLAHNLVFTAGVTGATRTIVEPGTSDELVLTPAAPGSYRYACTIHDGMTGRLVVLDAVGQTIQRGGARTAG
jgi:plastocyanin